MYFLCDSITCNFQLSLRIEIRYYSLTLKENHMLSPLTSFTPQSCAPHHTTTATIYDDNYVSSFVGTFDVNNCTARLIPPSESLKVTPSKGMRNIATPSLKELFMLLLGVGTLLGRR